MQIQLYFNSMTPSQIMDFKYKRAGAVRRQISKIDKAKDIRVRLVGKVVEKYNESLLLEDESGKREIKMDSSTIQSINIGENIRVFCRVLEDELIVELLQDMNNLDLDLYKKAFFS
ncbi:MAG: hypothetical protein HY831_05225 [Candidatus Aenigmarchaeota archaeon]|nr:hypothetical protein [Candidatus Aenigmarchaeota archaeon]